MENSSEVKLNCSSTLKRRILNETRVFVCHLTMICCATFIYNVRENQISHIRWDWLATAGRSWNHSGGDCFIKYKIKKLGWSWYWSDHTQAQNKKKRTRQHCCLTVWKWLVELANSETAAATPSGAAAKSLRSSSSLGSGCWEGLIYHFSHNMFLAVQDSSIGDIVSD